MAAEWLLQFQSTCFDLITSRGLWGFVRAHQHKTPRVLLYIIISGASSHTSHGWGGDGGAVIGLGCTLGSVGEAGCGCWVDSNPMSATRSLSVWEVI